MDRREELTDAQADLLRRMGTDLNALRNGDEGAPRWWIEGGNAVRRAVADALYRRKLIKLTGKWGGHPGVLGFTVTAEGLAALSRREEGR